MDRDQVLAVACPEPSGIYGHWWQVVPFFLLAVIGGVTVVYGFVRGLVATMDLVAGFHSRNRAYGLVADALFLRQHGERPPGAPGDPAAETWRWWERRAEDYLRSTLGQPPGESGSDPGHRLGAARQAREEQR